MVVLAYAKAEIMDPSTTLSPGHKAREDEYRARYIDVIRSCYSSYPEAVSYYEQLEDHIHRGSLRRRSDWPLLQVIKPFDVLLLRDIQSYPAVAPFKMAGEGYERKTPRIEVIEGYPSPDCIASLGARWNIRPEFFMEHIVPEHKLFEVPTLPSFQGNIIRIPFASVIRAFIDRPGLEGLARRRSEIENFRRLNEKKMFQDRRYGATRYRQINIHDNYISSVEQLVSLTVAKDGDSWCCQYHRRVQATDSTNSD